MRKRIIDPDFWLDEEIAKLSPHARLLYIGLWSLADDNYATFPDRPDWVKAQIFPYESVNTLQLLTELSEIGKLISFTWQDKKYLYVKNLLNYQRIEKPSNPKCPDYPDGKKYEEYLTSRGVFGESSVNTRSEVKLSKDKRSETNGREEKYEEKGNKLSPNGDRLAKLRENAHKLGGRHD